MDSGDPQLYVVGLFFINQMLGGAGHGESERRRAESRSI